MMGDELKLVPGFRFNPTDEELITYYLKPKVLGQVLPCSIISNVQLYGPDCDPWQLFHLDNPDKSLYVFTNLSKISAHPNMKSRFNTSKRAGSGTWVQKTKRKPIWDRAGNVIGGKRMLVFVINDNGVGIDLDKAFYFKMHEYSLWGVYESLGSDCGGGDLVLCQITFDPSRKSSFKLPAEKTHLVSRKGAKILSKKAHNKKSVAVMNTEVVMHSDVLQGSMSLNSYDLVAIDGCVGNGDQSDVAAVANIGVQDLEFEFDDGVLCFDGIGGESMCLDGLGSEDTSLEFFDIAGFMRSNQEEATEKTDHVSRKASDVPKKAQNRKNLEASASVTSKSVAVMNSDVLQEGISSETVVAIDGGVGNSVAVMNSYFVQESRGLNSESLVATLDAALDEIGVQDSDDFDWGLYIDNLNEDLTFDDPFLESLDIGGLMRSLDSTQEEELLEDRTIGLLGKRKFEEGGSSCQAKKMCI